MLGAFMIACGGDSNGAIPQGPSAEVKTSMEWVNVSGTREFVYGLKPEWRNRPIRGFRLSVGIRFHSHQNYWISGYRVKDTLRGQTSYVPQYISTELLLNSDSEVTTFDPAGNRYTCDILYRNTVLQLWGYKIDEYMYGEWVRMDRQDTRFNPELRNFRVIVDWTNDTIKFTITDVQILVIDWEPIF